MRFTGGIGRLTCLSFVFGMFSGWFSTAADLTWTGARSSEWNTTDTNWAGALVFQAGDSVTFPSASIFIGSNGIPAPVSPSSTRLNGNVMFSGGDILTGGIQSYGGGVTFSNYTTSLSFPGGLEMSGTFSFLRFDARSASNRTQIALGSGPIIFHNEGRLHILAENGRGIEFANDMVGPVSLSFNPDYGQTNGTVRFTGNIFHNGRLLIDNAGGLNVSGPFPDAVAGRLTLWQQNIRRLQTFLNGSYGTRPLELSADIVDGAGTASNRLEFSNYGMFGFRITGTNNSYRSGTVINSSPSAPWAPVTVAPESSLGTGDVRVEGLLHLGGPRNIHTNASVHLLYSGTVRIDNRAVIRLRAIQIGDVLHTAGRFHSNNTPRILGDGEFRVPSVNTRPNVSIPSLPTAVYAGSDITLTPNVTDPDGRVVRVEYSFNNGALVVVATNPPWSAQLTNVASHLSANRVTAFDDEGATNVFQLPNIQVNQPDEPNILSPHLTETNTFEFSFYALANCRYFVDATTKLPPTAWQQISVVQGAGGIVTVTNSTFASPSMFFRVRTGAQ